MRKRKSKEEILNVAPRNVIDALQVFDPSLRLMKNNAMGSDPNTLPEFYIRGQSGIGTKELDVADISQAALQNNPNTPIPNLKTTHIAPATPTPLPKSRLKTDWKHSHEENITDNCYSPHDRDKRFGTKHIIY